MIKGVMSTACASMTGYVALTDEISRDLGVGSDGLRQRIMVLWEKKNRRKKEGIAKTLLWLVLFECSVADLVVYHSCCCDSQMQHLVSEV